MKYRYNSYCSCARCRAHGFQGPAILITIGVLFLLDQMGHAHWMDFGFTWPALLIVIGVVKLLEHSASVYGHIPREYGAPLPPNAGQPMPPGTPVYPAYQPPHAPVTPPPPPAQAGFISPPPPENPDNKGGA
jgi:Domain of unknown function (DUF5668)